MRKIYLILFVLVLLLGFSGVAGAFSDNFNSGNLNNYLLTGSFSAGNQYAYNSNSVYQDSCGGSTSINNATYLLDQSINKYWSIKINTSYATSHHWEAGYAEYRFLENPSSYKSIRITLPTAGPGNPGPTSTVSIVNAGTYNSVTINNGVTVVVNVTDSGSIYHVVVTYENGTILDIQDTSKGSTVSSPDRLTLYSSAYNACGIATTTVNSMWDDVVATPLPAVPITNTFISWGSSEYTIGANPSFSWQVSDSVWSTWNCGSWPFNILPCNFYVEILKNKEAYSINGYTGQAGINILDLGSQTGSYSFSTKKEDIGIYEANLRKGVLVATSGIIVNASMVMRPQSTSYFNIAPTAFIKTNTTVTFHIGIGGIWAGLEWFYLDNGVEVREAGKGLVNQTDGTVNITFARVGTYNVYLKSLTGTAQTFPIVLKYDT